MTEPLHDPDASTRRNGNAILSAKRVIALDLLLGAIRADKPDMLIRAYLAVLRFQQYHHGGAYAVPAIGEVAALTTRFEVDVAANQVTAGPVTDHIDEFLADPSIGVRRQRPSRSATPEQRG